MQATRNAANRSCPKRKGKEDWVCYRLDEIHQLIGGVGGAIQKELNALQRLGILEFSESAIRIGTEPLSEAQELLAEASAGRSVNRPIPVPRRLLRFLACCSRPALFKTIWVYLLRGVTLGRDGTLNSRGSVKSSWIARIAGISLRAVKSARKLLVAMGWLSPDTNSSQRKLNRTGAYFSINLDLNWNDTGEWDEERLSTSESAPPSELSTSENAPPDKDINLSKETSKNQKLGEPTPSGVQKNALKPRPHLNDVKLVDLENFYRCEQLYRQAVKRKLIQHSESNALNWIAAAIRAKQEGAKNRGDAVKIFLGIVKKGLWNFITQEQEERARRALRHYRERSPHLYRLNGESSTSQNLERSSQGRFQLSNLLKSLSASLGKVRI